MRRFLPLAVVFAFAFSLFAAVGHRHGQIDRLPGCSVCTVAHASFTSPKATPALAARATFVRAERPGSYVVPANGRYLFRDAPKISPPCV